MCIVLCVLFEVLYCAHQDAVFENVLLFRGYALVEIIANIGMEILGSFIAYAWIESVLIYLFRDINHTRRNNEKLVRI